MSQRPSNAVRAAAGEAFGRRVHPGELLGADAGRVASACHEMGIRFRRGGKLIVFGNGGPSTDAQHISVEFMHPVIVGKRALPAISLTNDAATLTGVARRMGFDEVFAHQLRYLASSTDIALGVSWDGNCANVHRGLDMAKDMELLTIALTGSGGGAIARDLSVDHLFVAGSADPLVVKEVHVTTYHILWELVHVLLDQPGLLGSGVIL